MTYCIETSTLPEKGLLSERSVVKYRIALLASIVLCATSANAQSPKLDLDTMEWCRYSDTTIRHINKNISAAECAKKLATTNGNPPTKDLPNEHWRCGPYRIIIIPGSRYSLEENNQFEDYIVLKNGKRLHMPNRMRLGTAKDGARIAWWEGFSGETKTGYKYDAYGELITRDGKSYYSEIVTGGKTGKNWRETPKIPCKQT